MSASIAREATDMELERVRLKDFGCFRLRDFDFEPGINLIFGPNFSGKSTLVNAIFFSLTGAPIVPRVDASVIRNAHVATGTTGGTAGLQFLSEGERYLLYRGTGKRVQLRCERSGTWHVDYDETGPKAGERLLRERFGIERERLALTTFLREGEIFEFLARQSASRRDILHTLLGIDRLTGVRERFVEARRLAKREQQRVNSRQQGLQIRMGARDASHTIQQLEGELKSLKADYGADSGDADLVAEWEQEQHRLKREQHRLKREQASVLGKFRDIAHLRDMIGKIETGLAEATDLEEKRDGLLRQKGHLESEIKGLTDVCETLRGLVSDDVQACPTCYQPVERTVIVRVIDEKSAERSARCETLKMCESALAEVSAELKSRRELSARLEQLRSGAARFDRATAEIGRVSEALERVTARLSARGVSADDETNTARMRESAPLDRAALKRQIEGTQKRLETLRGEAAVRSARSGELEEVKAEAAGLEKTLRRIDLACAGVEATIAALQDQILEPAEAALREWVERMSLFGHTEIDLRREHLLPSLTIDGVDRSLMLLSGSEKMFLYLCFKVALAKVLGTPGFFVFDDPTLHLDGDRKALMVAFIRELSEEHQVVVTSYDSDVREGLSGAHLIETATMSEAVSEDVSD